MDPTRTDDTRWLEHCIALAEQAAARGEVPVGAVVVVAGSLVGEGSNRVEELRSPLAHAEMEALQQALATVGEKRLTGATVYCSLEPCFLCAGAILHVRAKRVVYAARDAKFGACRSLASVLEDPRLNHRCEVVEGELADASAALLRAFFRARR